MGGLQQPITVAEALTEIEQRRYLPPAIQRGFVWSKRAVAAPTWTDLSRACHHHAYELSATAAELGTGLESVDGLVRVVAKRVA